MVQPVQKRVSPNLAECSLKLPRWWQSRRSLGEIAEHLALVVEEKEHLERRFVEILAENNAFRQQSPSSPPLPLQTVEPPLSAVSNGQRCSRRGDRAEFAARENLMKDDFERKVQELRTGFQEERHQLRQTAEKMTKQLAGGICGNR